MAETLFGVSQSSLLLRPKIGSLHSDNSSKSISSSGGGRRRLQLSSLKLSRHQGFQAPFAFSTSHHSSLSVGVVSDPTASSNLPVDSGTRAVDIELDSGSGAGTGTGDGGDRGGGGGGNGSDKNRNDEGEDGSDGKKKDMAMSMSQKLTLGYAALVGGMEILLLCNILLFASAKSVSLPSKLILLADCS